MKLSHNLKRIKTPLVTHCNVKTITENVTVTIIIIYFFVLLLRLVIPPLHLSTVTLPSRNFPNVSGS